MQPPSEAAVPTFQITEETISPAFTDEWEALVYNVGGSFFQSPQWVRAWQKAYAPEAPLLALTARDADGALVGTFVLAELTRAVHRYAPLPLAYLGVAGSGAGSADRLGPLAESEDLARALFHAALGARPGRSVLLESLGPLAPPEVEGALTKTATCPVADLSDVEAVKALWSRKTRKNNRRHRRKAEDAGLSLRWYEPGEATADVLKGIGALHIARQQTLGRSGLFDEQRLRVLQAIGEGRYRDSDGLWVSTLTDASGVIRAGLMGFQYAGGFYEYKTGWDPDYYEVSPGKVLKTNSIERAIDGGLSRYEFLRGTESYKFRLGGENRPDTTVLVPRGAAGRLLAIRERFGAEATEHADEESSD
ncbi:GNAT family N-acetyltransferase [Rubricoccus marinus]|uniref:BioF2-like acetyltransferase domain-containing protein n=1 Tax=Rubricoccus marinus TaxID=716817 RepID=A0A259U0B1_9BACT|nr:GNAT family N-acetyltransferase [Rubricoccus marinus]OZC03421.1 hypothetical protein BSZ36_10780 [Rubricoccus marinus]